MDTAGIFHKLRSEVVEPSTGMIAVLEDVAVMEAMEENITAETRAHCTCMVAATAVEEKSGVAVARVAMDIGFGTRAAAGTMAHWQLDPG